jgi:hypothetical protein
MIKKTHLLLLLFLFSIYRERVQTIKDECGEMIGDTVIRVQAESLLMQGEGSDHASVTDDLSKSNFSARCLIKSDSISASTCVAVKAKKALDVSPLI